MAQAIVVTFIGPREGRGGSMIGPRFKATADAGSISVPSPRGTHGVDAAAIVAVELARKLGWKGTLVGGGLPKNGGYVFVFDHPHDRHAVK